MTVLRKVKKLRNKISLDTELKKGYHSYIRKANENKIL